MDLSLTLMSKLLAMMLWCAAGFLVVRIRLLKTDDSRILSVIIIYLLTPALLIRCFQIGLTPERLFSLVSCTVFSFAVHFIWIAVTGFMKTPLRLTPTERATLIFTNSGNLILPLVSMILGDDYLFCTAGYLTAFNVMLWTYGVSLISGRVKTDIKRILTNSNILSIVVGIFLLLAGIQIPDIIDTALEGFQEMVGPSSMLVIGMVMAGTNLDAVFTGPRYYMLAFLRLIVLPSMILALLYLSGVVRHYPVLREPLLISMLAVSAPPASMVTQIAVVWDGDAVSAGASNIICFVFSLVTMPLIVLLYQILI